MEKPETRTVHVIGAGLAGLAAAVSFAKKGRSVRVWEAAPGAGGRVRSFHDPVLGCVIDNGAHLVLSGNRSVRSYLDVIGASERVRIAEKAVFPFVDLENEARWQVRFGHGLFGERLPFWLLCPHARPPGAGAMAFIRDALCLLRAGPRDTVSNALDPASPWFRPFWAPLTFAVLNADPGEGSARLLSGVLRETLSQGGGAMRPLLARENLDHAFVAPAVSFLEKKNAPVRFGCRLKGVQFSGVRLSALDFGGETIALGPDDQVVLAVPGDQAAALVPDLTVPVGTRAILNAHFRLDGVPLDEGGMADGVFVGVLGGTAQWIFRRGNVISVTVSAADRFMDTAADELGVMLWADAARVLGIGSHPQPSHRVIKERRATVLPTPENEIRRSGPQTAWSNLFLAGDWTGTGLPGTIEGAVRSGFRAADCAGGL